MTNITIDSVAGGFRRRITVGALVAALASGSVGCTASGDGRMSRDDKIAAGAIAGAVVGGLIGYELLGGGQGRYLGALFLGAAGAYGGSLLADRLTRWDKTAMQETAYNTLTETPAGETSTWRNAESGNGGTITPIRTYLNHEGRICRDYKATLSVEGEAFDGMETACRTESGAWVVRSGPT